VTVQSDLDTSWRDRAACVGMHGALFFAGVGEGVIGNRSIAAKQAIEDAKTEAKKTCAVCPVTSECLDWALRTRTDEGIYGGVDGEERRRMRKRVSWQRRRTA